MNNNNLLRIGEASKVLGVHPDTLRNWEKEGFITPERVGDRGDRGFSKETIKKIKTRFKKEVEKTKQEEKTVRVKKWLARKVYVHRLHEALSKGELADKSGAGIYVINKIERNKVGTVKYHDIQRIANVLGVTVEYLLDEGQGIVTKGTPKIKSQKGYDEEDVKKMIEMKKKGRTLDDIGEWFNITGPRVHQLLSERMETA